MHGQNVIRKREDNPEQLQVHKVWRTIQGEGPMAGRTAVFIRLTGCNLRCHFCDTEWGDESDPVLAIDEIIRQVVAIWRPGDVVVLTGGEPMRQDVSLLFRCLLGMGMEIQVETAGTIWRDCLDHPRVTVVLSPKTGKVAQQFLDTHQYCWGGLHWKYVLRAGELADDGLPRCSTQKAGMAAPIARPEGMGPHNIWVSPCDEHEDHLNRANLTAVGAVALRHGYRVTLQMHKYLDVE